MNYIKQINTFYLTLEYKPLSANAISLWHALMNIANRTGWQEYFTVANKVLESKSGLNISSLQRARNELLQTKGLIEYKKGNNQYEASTYKVLALYEQPNAQASEQPNAQASEQANEQASEHITKLNKTETKQNKRDNPLTPFEGEIEEPKKEDIDYQEIVELYHEHCPSLPSVIKLTDKRKSHIRSRANDFDLETVEEVFEIAGKSEFLQGNNNRNWQANFDWLLNPNNFIKVLEGRYDQKLKEENSEFEGVSTVL